jgi:hypothetical protein
MAYWIVIVNAEEVAVPGSSAASDAVPALATSDAGRHRQMGGIYDRRVAVASVPVHGNARKEVASRQRDQSVPRAIDWL